MSTFGDAVVIRILADSSGVQGPLDDVHQRLDDLTAKVSQLAGSSSAFQRLGAAISGLQTPLQSIGRVVEQVQRQLDALSRTTVSLNISPAISALQTLSAMIANVQAQLNRLSMGPIGPGGPGGGGGMPTLLPPQTIGPIRQFADGGLVDGPDGVDRVPAWLTAGEFVLNRDAVRQLGVSFLQQMNSTPHQHASSRPFNAHEPAAPSITTQFGGITIQVQHPSDLGSILDTLAIEELQLRNRRG